MHDVEIEVVDFPILQLLLANRLDLFLVVKGIPEFGNDEELFALYEAVLDGPAYALAAFLLVAIVCLLSAFLFLGHQ